MLQRYIYFFKCNNKTKKTIQNGLKMIIFAGGNSKLYNA